MRHTGTLQGSCITGGKRAVRLSRMSMNYAKTVNKQDFADAAVLTFGESVIVNVIHVSSHLDSLAKGTFFFSQSFTHTIDFDIFSSFVV